MRGVTHQIAFDQGVGDDVGAIARVTAALQEKRRKSDEVRMAVAIEVWARLVHRHPWLACY